MLGSIIVLLVLFKPTPNMRQESMSDHSFGRTNNVRATNILLLCLNAIDRQRKNIYIVVLSTKKPSKKCISSLFLFVSRRVVASDTHRCSPGADVWWNGRVVAKPVCFEFPIKKNVFEKDEATCLPKQLTTCCTSSIFKPRVLNGEALRAEAEGLRMCFSNHQGYNRHWNQCL